jgi:pimeloyl-ACP methyl ester carboxylesterase
MPTTPPEKPRRRWLRRTAAALLLVTVALVLRRVLLVTFLALKILGYPAGFDGWKGPVRRQNLEHAGIPIDVYGESPGAAILIVHGVNPTGKDSLDLVRISQAMAQAGYQVFVPDLAGMKRQRLLPEEIEHIKTTFQFIGREAAIACFSYGCGPAMVAAADAAIRDRIRFALAFGGYFDAREAMEFVITGPTSPMTYLKWVYLRANSDIVPQEADSAQLRRIAESPNPEETIAGVAPSLSTEARSLLDVFTASSVEEFRTRLVAAPEALQTRLDALSPSRFVAELRAPLILVHGVNDPAIPAEQAIRFDEAARANGLKSNLTLLRMYGHVQPILPEVRLSNFFGYYIPEAARFGSVVNRVVWMMGNSGDVELIRVAN